MTENKILEITPSTRIFRQTDPSDIADDKRLLIPYTNNYWIGFMSSKREIIVNPKYFMYNDDCCSETDYIRVAVPYLYGEMEKSGVLNSSKLRALWGLINYRGEEVLPCNYPHILLSDINKETYVVENRSYKWGIIDTRGHEIIPFGKYNNVKKYIKDTTKSKV